ERDGPIGEILREVVALFRRLRRLDLMVVVDEVRIVLMRVSAQKPVVALEAAAERPAIVRAGGADLLGWRQVPLADAVGGIPVLLQHLGEEPVLEGNRAVAAGKSSGPFRDA